MNSVLVKGKYRYVVQDTSETISINVAYMKLKAKCMDSIFFHSPSFNSITLDIKELELFIIDYNDPKKSMRF